MHNSIGNVMHDIILIKPFAPVPFLFSNYPGKIYFEFKKQLIKSNPLVFIILL
jgi:hypothetical protein